MRKHALLIPPAWDVRFILFVSIIAILPIPVAGTIWLTWYLILLKTVTADESDTSSCIFNSMCMCSPDQINPNPSIDSIACYSVPFYKFPVMPVKQIDRIEVLDSMIPSLEADTLNSCELQALVFNNNKLQHISDKIFSCPIRCKTFNYSICFTNCSSSLETLVSLDLSYNRLDEVPFHAIKDLKNLHWLNLHGNQISSTNGEWSHMKNTLSTLFIGQNDITEIADTSSHSIHSGIRQLKSLTWLNADANKIHKIHKHSLPSSLKTVSFSYNLLENFPLDIISTMPHLEWLYLRGNHIKTIPEHTFERKFWIQKIDLNQNFLKTLPVKPFNHSIFVRDVFLGMNDFQTVTAGSFAGLDCRRIVFSYNQIEYMEEDSFQGVENTLEYLDLDHNKLRTFPAAVTQLLVLRFLYMSYNLLNELPEDALVSFQNSLKALTLSGNRLSSVPSITLRNCTKLSYLNLASNQISEIQTEDFEDWGLTIQTININNNRITNLNNKVFKPMSNLRELSLNYNPLRNVEEEAFSGLTNLESLELSSSFERDDLPYEAFKDMQSLKYLYLDHNNFHDIKMNSFDGLLNIEYLNLDSNKIQYFPPTLLKAGIHSKLSTVVLSNNELPFIDSNTFRDLESLEVVWMNDNKLTEIKTNAFYGLPHLTTLILRDNEINYIHPGAFSHLPAVKQLDLQYNHLTKVDLSILMNFSSPLNLNSSYNQISVCTTDTSIAYLENLDLRHNKIIQIPECLRSTPLLKKLNLDSNAISSLEGESFKNLAALEQMSIHRNTISNVDRRAFVGMQNLQLLDLSKNVIEFLHNHQFTECPNLRVLNLKDNALSYLPREVFAKTQLEFLDISYNSFAVVPRESLSDIGMTLRHLSLQSNVLEHVDVTSFPDIPYMNYLDMSKNKLTILPDNVFTQLSWLQYLDLSSNPLRANFKELFHYAQNLKHLNLANTGLTSTPNFPLPDLVHLNLSSNNLQTINKVSFQNLGKLKSLDLSHCNLNYVPSHLWMFLTNLKELDLSYNNIKEITVDSFHGLKSLQSLDIQQLKRLTRFEGKSFVQLRILSELSMQTLPIVENFYEELCYLLSHLTQLRRLKLNVVEHELRDQLSCLSNKKLISLEINGRNLQTIHKDAFVKLSKNPSLTIRISGTQITDLPGGLFAHMYQIQHLSIDLSNNMLKFLTPETFYGNVSTWDDIGTGLVSGGLVFSGNHFQCGCHLAWLGHWLRRWSRENFNPRTSNLDYISTIQEATKDGICWDSSISRHVPIMKLPPVDMSCQASALSSSADSVVISHFLAITLFLLGFGS